MELEFVKIKNYLSFDSRGFDLNLSNINVFTGPNASGKTNLLRTLWYVGSRINAGYFAPPRKYEDSRQRRPSEEIEVGLSLDDSEAATLADYLILSPLGDNVNPAEGEVPGVAQQLSFRIAAALPRKKLQGWFRKVSIVLKEGGFPVESPLVLLKIQISGKDLFISRSTFSRFPVGNPIGMTRPFARLMVDVAERLDSTIKAKLQSPAYDENGALNISLNFGPEEMVNELAADLTDEKFAGFPLPSSFNLVNIENRPFAAEYAKNLRRFFQDSSTSDRQIDLLTIVGTLYKRTLVGTSDLRLRPEDYVPLASDVEKTALDMSQVDGRKLSLTLFYLKNSPLSAERERFQQIRDSLHDLSGTFVDVVLHTRRIDPTRNPREIPLVITVPAQLGLREENLPTVSMGSDSSSYEIMVVVKDRDTWVPLGSSAAGVFELLVLLTILIGQEHKVLLLDEPALNLHPTKQVQLRKILEKSASSNQILIVTHSPLLVSMDLVDRTWRFHYDSKGTIAIGLKDLGYSPSVRRKIGGAITDEEWGALLFASGLVLAEGPGDKFAIEEFDLKLGKRGASLREDNWPTMNPGGKDSIGVIMDVCDKLRIPVVALTDRDGITACNSKTKYGRPPHSIPNIFSSLIRMNKISGRDAETLATLPILREHYEDSVFDEARAIARRNGVFALTGSLEDALNLKKQRRGNLRLVIDTARNTESKDVPKEFVNFFKFVREKKRIATNA